MASEYRRLLDVRGLSADQQMRDDEAWDAGAYTTLQVHVRLIKAGTGSAGGQIKLRHAAVNELDAWVDLSGAQWTIDSTGAGGFLTISNYLRYISWYTDNNVAGDPIVVIDIVAKE